MPVNGQLEVPAGDHDGGVVQEAVEDGHVFGTVFIALIITITAAA